MTGSPNSCYIYSKYSEMISRHCLKTGYLISSGPGAERPLVLPSWILISLMIVGLSSPMYSLSIS